MGALSPNSKAHLMSSFFRRWLRPFRKRQASTDELLVSARRSLAEGNYEGALDSVGELLRLNGADSGAKKVLTEVLLEHPDRPMVDHLLAQLRDEASNPEPVVLLQMRSAIDQGKLEAGVELGKHFLRARPRNPKVVVELVAALELSARPQEALRVLKSYHSTYGASVGVLEKGLRLAKRSSSRSVTAEWVELVLSVDPHSALARDQQFTDLMANGQTAEARKAAIKVRARPGRTVRPVFKSVFNCIRCGEFEHASALLEGLADAPDFAFERTLVSALLAISSGDLDRADHLVRQASADASADRRLAIVLHQLAAAYTTRDAPNDRSVAEQLQAWRDNLLHAPVSDAARDSLRQNGRILNEILSTTQSRNLLEEQPDRISFICPVHRSRDVENIVRQVARQRWRNAEAVFFPNGEVTKDQILAHWDRDSEIELVLAEDESAKNIGEILNATIDASRGDYICRMDADNWYFPEYTGHMMCCLRHFGADLVHKQCRFTYLRALSVYFLIQRGVPFEKAGNANTGVGGTHFFHRRVFDRIRFESVSVGEDSRFIAACRDESLHVRHVDPFHFVSVRSEDSRSHTWNVSDAQLLFLDAVEIFHCSNDFPDFLHHQAAVDGQPRGEPAIE